MTANKAIFAAFKRAAMELIEGAQKRNKDAGIIYPEVLCEMYPDSGFSVFTRDKKGSPNKVFHETNLIQLAETMDVTCWVELTTVEGVVVPVVRFPGK